MDYEELIAYLAFIVSVFALMNPLAAVTVLLMIVNSACSINGHRAQADALVSLEPAVEAAGPCPRTIRSRPHASPSVLSRVCRPRHTQGIAHKAHCGRVESRTSNTVPTDVVRVGGATGVAGLPE